MACRECSTCSTRSCRSACHCTCHRSCMCGGCRRFRSIRFSDLAGRPPSPPPIQLLISPTTLTAPPATATITVTETATTMTAVVKATATATRTATTTPVPPTLSLAAPSPPTSADSSPVALFPFTEAADSNSNSSIDSSLNLPSESKVCNKRSGSHSSRNSHAGRSYGSQTENVDDADADGVSTVKAFARTHLTISDDGGASLRGYSSGSSDSEGNSGMSATRRRRRRGSVRSRSSSTQDGSIGMPPSTLRSSVSTGEFDLLPQSIATPSLESASSRLRPRQPVVTIHDLQKQLVQQLRIERQSSVIFSTPSSHSSTDGMLPSPPYTYSPNPRDSGDKPYGLVAFPRPCTDSDSDDQFHPTTEAEAEVAVMTATEAEAEAEAATERSRMQRHIRSKSNDAFAIAATLGSGTAPFPSISDGVAPSAALRSPQQPRSYTHPPSALTPFRPGQAGTVGMSATTSGTGSTIGHPMQHHPHHVPNNMTRADLGAPIQRRFIPRNGAPPMMPPRIPILPTTRPSYTT
ncbi:hypothetical protein GQ42DRAFT_587 [Ramicandelaber brevisporus]|nr:hypothetical protein GQ42DRAFT_587 [Ramicandelaber brevisporus]